MHSDLEAKEIIYELKFRGILIKHPYLESPGNPKGHLDLAGTAMLKALLATLPGSSHNHYYKDVSHLKTVDVYRIISLYGVTDPCTQHILKKCLVQGGRGGAKDATHDMQDIRDTADRWLAMSKEDKCTTN